ncbi:MAG: transporter substrate-binding domain-containing protein [Candidatus Rokubacteria bacterium]|nr:transporter substrate-binding domain-containing protein [Candidatus Rokubacteria bacterium]
MAIAALLSLGGPVAAQQPLAVGLDATFAPHAMPKLGGGVEGFNVDMANEIGRRLGRPVNVVAQEWAGLIPGLQAKRFDFLAAPTTVTAERAKSLLFSEGYLNTDYQFAIKKEAPGITKLEDLKGKTIAVNRGSIYDTWARQNAEKYGFQVESFGTQADAVQAVLAGRAFANLAGNTAVAWAVQKTPGLKLSYTIKTGLVFAIPFRKDDVALRNQVEDVLECMKLDGFFARLSEKWLGVKPESGSPAVTVSPGYGQPGFEGHIADKPAPKCN